MLAKTSMSQLRWCLFEKDEARFAYVQKELDADWDHLGLCAPGCKDDGPPIGRTIGPT